MSFDSADGDEPRQYDEGAVPEPEGASLAPEAAAEHATALEVGWRRLHPLSPLLRGGLVLLVIVGILIANMRDRLIELFFLNQVDVDFNGESGDVLDLVDYLAQQQMLIWALLIVAAVLLLIVGIAWLSWRCASFRITSEAVEARRGILFKQHRRAPLDRIQSVNLQRSLLARLVGLTQVDVQTGGQGGTVALQYLGHRDAKRVREQILLAVAATKAPAASTAPGPSMQGASAQGSPSPGSLAAQGSAEGLSQGIQGVAQGAGSSGSGPAGSFAAVDPTGQPYAEHSSRIDAHLREIADFDIDPGARESGSLIKVPFGRLVASILLSSEMLIMLLLIAGISVSIIWAPVQTLLGALPVVLILVSILISHFNKGFNFTLSRSADGVRVGAGLTATTTETIPFGRIHAVEALQPLGWRPFGWWKVRITTAGHSLSQGGQNRLMNSVLPVGHVDDVLRVFETLLHSGEEGSDQRAAALRDSLVGAGQGYLRAGPRAGLVLLFGRRRAGLRIEHADTERASLRVRRGWFTRSLVEMPVLRAQSVQLHRPFLHRLLGLASITAHTVLGPVVVRMRGIALDQAQQAFDLLAAAVVRVQGAEAEQRVVAREAVLATAHAPAHAVAHSSSGAGQTETSSFTSDPTIASTTDIHGPASGHDHRGEGDPRP